MSAFRKVFRQLKRHIGRTNVAQGLKPCYAETNKSSGIFSGRSMTVLNPKEMPAHVGDVDTRGFYNKE